MRCAGILLGLLFLVPGAAAESVQWQERSEWTMQVVVDAVAPCLENGRSTETGQVWTSADACSSIIPECFFVYVHIRPDLPWLEPEPRPECANEWLFFIWELLTP